METSHMTKPEIIPAAQRAEWRKLCERRTEIETHYPIRGWASEYLAVTANMAEALPSCLDALDAAEREIERLKVALRASVYGNPHPALDDPGYYDDSEDQ